MIKKNNQTIDKIYKGTTEIAKIYKGSTLVYENYRDIVATGNDIINITKAKANSLNYLKAFGKCEQRRLPVGYTELESISGITNKAWFDSGIAGNNNNLRFVFTGYKGSGVAYTPFFANYVDESSNVTRFIAGSSSNGIIAEVNRKSASSIITNTINYLVAHTYELYKENGISILKVDGVQVNTMANSAGTENSTNIAINGNKINPSTPSSDVVTTFQGNFQIYDGTTLIRNYIMAKRDSDNAVGMYDTVNDTFKASEGTDNFTAGAEVAPTPSNPIPIWGNNGELKVRSKSGLPSGYSKLSYLESTGTQYLKLGVNDSNPNLEIETTFSDIGGSGYRYIIGCWSNDNNQNTVVYISGSNQIGAWVCHSYIANAMLTSDITEKHTVKVNKDAYYLDGNLVISMLPSGIERTGAELYAFKRNGAGGTSPQTTSISGKIYNISFKDNGVLIRNFIPARRNSDNELGMYDLVNNTFLTNQGTGTFTAGPDIDDTEVYIDGTTETIKDSLNNTATAENLLSVGTYKDVQSVLDGTVTRNVGVKVLTGDEDWIKNVRRPNAYSITLNSLPNIDASQHLLLCTHFTNTQNASDLNYPNYTYAGTAFNVSMPTTISTVDQLKDYFKQQYANHTPVIVVYPLATPTTETATAQLMNIQKGTNIIEITEASLDNLEVEVKYKGK